MSINERIKKAIDHSGLTQIKIGEILGIPQTRVSEMVRGVVKNPKIKMLVELAKITRVNLIWLVTGEGEMIESKKVKIGPDDLILVPVIGTVSAGIVSYESQEIKDEKMWFFAKNIPRDSFALRIVGDSMVPELNAGDVVVCSPKQLAELKGKGEIVVIKIDAEDSMIKCLHFNQKSVILTSVNHTYSPIVAMPYEIKSVSKVMLKIKKY